MGNFTDDLFSAAKKPGNVPIGSTRYSMAEVSFFLKQTPKELLGGVVAGFIQQMEKAGQYGQAKEMHANPQPFYGNPQCLAVFMAASIELDKRDKRIAKLEGLLGELADDLGDDDSRVGTLLRHAFQEFGKGDDDMAERETP